SIFFEIGTFAAYGMYEDVGGAPCAGVISGIGKVQNINFMIIANDATVKAGAYFEISLKKTLRSQQIAIENNLPIIYLVDSAGVFLPMQDQVFPDEAHFGKIFYNNAKISSIGLTQIACVMGPCVAGGAYLPVMCDKYIITEGSNMFLAAPALVKAAIGQVVDAETLGGATTHSSISGIADYHEKSDIDSLSRIKSIVKNINFHSKFFFNKISTKNPKYDFENLFNYIDTDNQSQYDIREVIVRLTDDSLFDEYKKNYGKTIVCGNAIIGGYKVGIIANQKLVIKTNDGKMQLGGVIYNDSADKAARFVMACNQDKVPIVFMHDVNGFMVGKDAEWSGIAKDGAKMVNAVSNSTVPKITIIIGGSYGAGNYAMSGKAYNPQFIYAWPNAKIAVMGGEQAAQTLTQIKLSKVGKINESEKKEIFDNIKSQYDKQSDIKYGAARLWVDNIINPKDTRFVIIKSLDIVSLGNYNKKPNYGVFQV
ncbi:carboxyl transferase domain-containing protein, partial [Candidatus Marinimicrobia bacterium]|nr:carboxyl transferase domain-containing protein [Candidatus Neomarinimicrobiota bacterium]